MTGIDDPQQALHNELSLEARSKREEIGKADESVDMVVLFEYTEEKIQWTLLNKMNTNVTQASDTIDP